ncbi:MULTISPECIES: type VII secretion protein EccB [Streptomycetaceae]|uniref:Type VII secretion protein EccB n=1 Tax=Streptantibioticus cattleyicolor (strain ATCC 35852 / DSM 46488 / JCM 4925 / NBRC 14057 / NRRL 8057) TaxID=1003195 RepID=F8JUN3_STREN|nr:MULTISPECIES: type VII secretion protein EccB [Streptomycetaceae]AEW96862.1 hypothetical protein SCATT_44910 [Streptantibioticus cattleyicolor NRRL 8057 = DSM 46488]MYS61341.1 type VII secretion protein EccB [Streptomyces sp. SID5468]CCB77191.1 conserved protein of unknown function [Streptantibioticus cattleyicolor NRRL 8057 = DSM 46488]
MASRRDELNAYTFARKRTVAAFLRPSAGGSDEGAPRPLKALGPGLAAGALLLAGFGAWGMIRPGAPEHWDTPGAKVLVGSESTTRYVVLESGGRRELHPVLNLASAKLLLDPRQFGVLKVDESVLDNGKLPHGPTLGIPYAPDRMPSAQDAGTAKQWAVCEEPDGGDAGAVRKAAFVLSGRDAARTEGGGRLHGDQALYVQTPDRAQYLVDPAGTAHLIGGPAGGAMDPADRQLLVRTVFAATGRSGAAARPQPVTADWLATFTQGRPLEFPVVDGLGTRAGVPGLDPRHDRVGMVLTAPGTGGPQKYVVLRGGVAPVSDLVARLLLNLPEHGGHQVTAMYPGGLPQPQPVAAQDFTPLGTPFYGDRDWPQAPSVQVDAAGQAETVCSVYLGAIGDQGRPKTAVWAGRDYPAPVADGTSAYVTPGSGLLYRQVTGANQPDNGQVYLVTDTGLRYAVPGGGTADASAAGQQPAGEAQTRLGYAQVRPVPVPRAWSDFLPKGPTLDMAAAGRPQGS